MENIKGIVVESLMLKRKKKNIYIDIYTVNSQQTLKQRLEWCFSLGSLWKTEHELSQEHMHHWTHTWTASTSWPCQACTCRSTRRERERETGHKQGAFYSRWKSTDLSMSLQPWVLGNRDSEIYTDPSVSHHRSIMFDPAPHRWHRWQPKPLLSQFVTRGLELTPVS